LSRRADPAALPRPEAQWPKIPSLIPSGFDGFLPESFEMEQDAMIGAPDMQRRMRVASLDSPSAHLWRTR
jgi:hypothetical protein